MTKSLVSAAKMIGGAAVAGAIIKAFVNISKESEKLAISAEEIEGKFNVVFRNVSDAANDMASRLGDDFDLTSSTVQELLGNTGDLVTGFGLTQDAALKVSDATNRLALDLASFTNAQGGAAAVSKALTSAYSGERESLKTYGIVISEADVKARMLLNSQKGLTFESEKAAKINATLALASEQSKNALGDYSRTAESGANVQRTLNEQIKRSKELWGSALTEGLTPMRSAFRDFLKEINDAQESEKNITDALFGEGANLEQAVSDLKELEKTQQAIFDAQATGSGDDYARVQLRQTQDRLAQLEKELEIYNRRESAIKQNKLTLDAEAEAIRAAAEEGEKRKNLSIAAFAEIESRRVAALTSEEKQLELIDKAIDKWAEYRDVAGVQELINSLVAERNELMKEDIVLNNESAEAAARRINDQIMFEDALADREKRRAEESAIAQEAYNQKMVEYNQLLEAAQLNAEQLATVALTSVASGFEAVGKAIVEGGVSFKTFGKLALSSLADILSSMGAQLAAQAAVLLFGPTPWKAAGALAASAAAYTGAGIARASAGSFEDGGIVPGTSYTGDNMLANVNSGEMVLNKGQQQNLFNQLQGGGGGNQNITLIVDGEQFTAHFQKQFDNGGLRVPQRNVV